VIERWNLELAAQSVFLARSLDARLSTPKAYFLVEDMSEQHRHKTRHVVASQPKITKRIAYVGHISTAGHAPAELGIVQLDPKNEDMVIIQPSSVIKTPLVRQLRPNRAILPFA